MPISVSAVVQEPGVAIPIKELARQMSGLPAPGTRYWHGPTGYRVQQVEGDAQQPRVHLVRDREWEQETYGAFPTGIESMPAGVTTMGRGTLTFIGRTASLSPRAGHSATAA